MYFTVVKRKIHGVGWSGQKKKNPIAPTSSLQKKNLAYEIKTSHAGKGIAKKRPRHTIWVTCHIWVSILIFYITISIRSAHHHHQRKNSWRKHPHLLYVLMTMTLILLSLRSIIMWYNISTIKIDTLSISRLIHQIKCSTLLRKVLRLRILLLIPYLLFNYYNLEKGSLDNLNNGSANQYEKKKQKKNL
jgi:hypothetical protein